MTKTYIRIGGALILGAALVAGTFMVRNTTANSPDTTGQLAVVEATKAPEKGYIPSTDADGDGIADWEEELKKRYSHGARIPTTTLDYEPPDTLTGKFAVNFFQDFMSAQTSPSTAIQNKDVFINANIGSLSEEIRKDVLQNQVQKKDLVIVAESDFAVREYGNQIINIIQTQTSKTKNDTELNILKRALETQDPSILDEIQPIIGVYKNVLDDTKKVPTPPSLVKSQLALVNAYQVIINDLEAMHTIFSDPLKGIVYVRKYQEDVHGLIAAYKSIIAVINERGVIYSKDESGYMIYQFDI